MRRRASGCWGKGGGLCPGCAFLRGLGREDLVAVGGEPGGVAAAAGAHVEDVGAGVWEEVEDRGVDLLEGEVFVGAGQGGGLGVVGG